MKKFLRFLLGILLIPLYLIGLILMGFIIVFYIIIQLINLAHQIVFNSNEKIFKFDGK